MPTFTLPAFTGEEAARAHLLLATRVAHMMGRKFEEGDWADVYCGAKRLRVPEWSNLNADIELPGLALEHKMLRREDSRPLREWCGTWLMHPALTRQVTLPADVIDPNEAMASVIAGYQRVLDLRRARVQQISEGREVEMRSGWLVYQSSLREFLYFEEFTRNLDPAAHYAEWSERASGSTRRGSRNLWIFERATGQKIWSVTGAGSGTKIQPYFQVPPANDPHLYVFRVQGDVLETGLVRVWVTESTANALERRLGDLSVERLSQAIMEAAAVEAPHPAGDDHELARELLVTTPAYERLQSTFAGVSDEHSFQLLVRQLIA